MSVFGQFDAGKSPESVKFSGTRGYDPANELA